MSGNKDDIEFIISGEDHMSKILKGLAHEYDRLEQQSKQTGNAIDRSMKDAGGETKKTASDVKTLEKRLEEVGRKQTEIKQLSKSIENTRQKISGAGNEAQSTGRKLETGFNAGEKAAKRLERQTDHLKKKIQETASSAKNLMSEINGATAGFQGFVGDHLRRGAMVGTLAVTGFATHSVMKDVNYEYELTKMNSPLKQNYINKGVFDKKSFDKDMADLNKYVIEQGLRTDRETDILGYIGMAKELGKNNMDAKVIKAALPVVADFAQANSEIAPDEASKYLANKLEAAAQDYTPKNFERVADQFTMTVDMSSLDPRDLLYAEKYTDFTNAIGDVDFAISQAMQVVLSKISVEGEKAGTALRTLFLESTQLDVSDAAMGRISSASVANVVKTIVKEVNSVNKQVEADRSVPTDQKGNEKILRKSAILNKHMQKLSKDEQLEVGSTLFGKEAASVTTLFTDSGYKQMLETIEGLHNSKGITKRYADDRANTSKGELVALGKSIDAIQVKVGEALNPMLKATTEELTNLATKGKFSFDTIRRGVEESSKELKDKLNVEIGETYSKVMNLAVNGFQIGEAMTPLAEGAGSAILKLLNGDVAGASKDIVLAIDATDLKIENLPGELQGLAKMAENAAIGLALIWGVSKAIDIGEKGTKVWKAGQKFGEKVKDMTSKRKNSSNVPAIDNDKTIRANVVHVYGDKVNGGGKGGSSGGVVPVSNEKPEVEKKKKMGKGNVGRAAGLGAGAWFVANMFGANEFIPEDVKSVVDNVAIGAAINSWLGNPVGHVAESTGAGAVIAEGAVTMGGTAGALLLSAGVGSAVGTTVNHLSGNAKEEKIMNEIGAGFWFTNEAKDKLRGQSGDQTYIYQQQMKTVGNMLMGYRNQAPTEVLNQLSQELWEEAVKNVKNNTTDLFGNNVDDPAAYIDEKMKKKLVVQKNVDNIRMSRLTNEEIATAQHYLPKEGTWRKGASNEPTARNRVQQTKETENDPFVKGSFKTQMLDEMLKPVSQQNDTINQGFTNLIAEFNRWFTQPKDPIQVNTVNRLKVHNNTPFNLGFIQSPTQLVDNTPNRLLTPRRAMQVPE
ncbi:phage tail tape measure protein [Brevibacillus laterosporus]|uniref:phage tail tape measure protein n=1 Tax=Brevibacillus laterosporus TaxID=1465 RepID=UPI0018CEB60F|nr:phage tail tape measure protein [Brevibacillus laterosporus]MBG9797134.1 hypothetical protein [Brevibacillus laterosporus]MED1909564.1 phage tail tape measure protein [Brevibacillus laterosporus]